MTTGADETLEDLRRGEPVPPPPAADLLDLRAGESARAVLDATGDPPHDCAILLRRAVAILEAGFTRNCLRAPRAEAEPHRVHLPGWQE